VDGLQGEMLTVEGYVVRGNRGSRQVHEILGNEEHGREIASSKPMTNSSSTHICLVSLLRISQIFSVSNPVTSLPIQQQQKHPHKHTSQPASANTEANASSSPNPH